jgi:hypothetical protein
MEDVTQMVVTMATEAKATWMLSHKRAWDAFDMAKALSKQGIKVHCTGTAMQKRSADKLVTIQPRHLDTNLSTSRFYKV